MKFAGYILAFYLILLTAVPCCGFDDCPDEKKEQASNHENGDEECGNCSPFFSCEGCATATIAFEPVQLNAPPVLLIPVYAGYIQPVLPQVNYDFWQPPKLG